jgi:hypothetical protein
MTAKSVADANIPDLDKLNDEQRVALNGYVARIWEQVCRLMDNAEAGMSVRDLDWKMEMYVQGLALEVSPAERGLVLVGSQIVQRRYRTLLRLALRTEEGKRVAEAEAREASDGDC